MVTRVLVATDGSDNARRAEAVACKIAAGLSARLVLVHTVTETPSDQDLTGMAEIMQALGPQRNASMHAESLSEQVRDTTGRDHVRSNADLMRTAGERVLENAADRAREAGVEHVETRLVFGDPADNIVDVAQSEGVDLIVVGTRGLGGVRGRLMGSVSQKIMKEAPQSTLVVKPSARGREN